MQVKSMRALPWFFKVKVCAYNDSYGMDHHGQLLQNTAHTLFYLCMWLRYQAVTADVQFLITTSFVMLFNIILLFWRLDTNTINTWEGEPVYVSQILGFPGVK